MGPYAIWPFYVERLMRRHFATGGNLDGCIQFSEAVEVIFYLSSRGRVSML